MTANRPSGQHYPAIAHILTPRRMALAALAAAAGYAIVGFAAGGDAMIVVYLCVPPLLLLSGVLWLRWRPAAWAGAGLSVALVLFGFLIGPLAGGILALTGLAALMSELARLRYPHESRNWRDSSGDKKHSLNY